MKRCISKLSRVPYCPLPITLIFFITVLCFPQISVETNLEQLKNNIPVSTKSLHPAEPTVSNSIRLVRSAVAASANAAAAIVDSHAVATAVSDQNGAMVMSSSGGHDAAATATTAGGHDSHGELFNS